MPQLTNEIILAAIAGFEQQKSRMDEQIERLKAMLSGRPSSTSATPSEAPPRKRRRVSAAARRRMRDAQRARWAKVKGETAPSSQAKAQSIKPKRRLSEAGRQAIIAATKKRWRLQKANAKKAPPATAKKTARKKASSAKGARKKATGPTEGAGAAPAE